MTLSPVQQLCETIDVTILSGAALSAGDFLQGRILTGVYMPASWTAAGLTFLASHDGATYYSVYADTSEYAATTAAAGVYVALDGRQFLGVKYLKVRSGTSGTPVNQGGDRVLKLMCGAPDKPQ